jgi:hypothetical protein
MLLFAVSVLVAAQPSSEVAQGLMNYPAEYSAKPFILPIKV